MSLSQAKTTDTSNACKATCTMPIYFIVLLKIENECYRLVEFVDNVSEILNLLYTENHEKCHLLFTLLLAQHSFMGDLWQLKHSV